MIYPIAVISSNDKLRLDMLNRLQKHFELASVKARFFEFKHADDFDNHEQFEAIFVDCEAGDDYRMRSQAWFKTHPCHIVLLIDKLSAQIQLSSLIYTLTLLKEDYAAKFETIIDSVLDSLYLNNYVQDFTTSPGQKQRFPLPSILYAKYHERYTHIHTLNQGIFEIRMPMRRLLEAYNTYHLCTINKGLVVNWMNIKNLNNKQIYLCNGECLDIAPRRLKEIRSSFLFYCKMPN